MTDKNEEAKPAKEPGKNADVEVQFHKSYVASRGAGISGGKGQKRTYPWTPQLKALCDDGICSIVREVSAKKRETATRKPPKE